MIATTRNLEALTYDATPGPFTDLSAHSAIVCELPEPLPELCRVVQGLIVHPFLAHLYGLEPQHLCQDDLQMRSASEILDRVLAVDPRSLSEPRPPERRFVGNCRHFTVLLCALLRARGLPARARCGFGAYFAPPRFEDHWVCEVWDESRGAWRLVDAQLDAVQREALGIAFDPLDVPRAELHRAGRRRAARRRATRPRPRKPSDLRTAAGRSRRRTRSAHGPADPARAGAHRAAR